MKLIHLLAVTCLASMHLESLSAQQITDSAIQAAESVQPPSESAPVVSDSPGEPSLANESDVVDAEPAEGHSYHGEAFNEGPRQSAYLMDAMGEISFPVTTKSPEAQRFFDQGIAQLHGFWFFESERSFRQAATLDPDCAMAYWGMAMSNRNNEERARGFIEKAVSRKALVTPREIRYIDSLNDYFNGKADKKQRCRDYVRALEDIIYHHPDDIEAKAFLGVQLWYNNGDGIPLGSYTAVDSLLEDVFEKSKMHPAHHYRIHLWDNRRSESALDSAAKCGPSAPGIAHMWHMPGHIYSRLHRYEDAAWQQEASARVDHAHMQRDHVMPDQIHNFAHNNEWLVRNLNYVGRVQDAVDLSKNMISLPCHPDYNTDSKRGSFAYGRQRLLETLDQYERWQELVDLCETQYLPPTENPTEQVRRLRFLARAHYRLGNAEAGNEILDQLNQRLAACDHVVSDLPPSPYASDAPAEKKKPADNKAELQKAVDELSGLAAYNTGDYELALQQLEKAGDIDKIFLATIRCKKGEAEKAIVDARNYVKQKTNQVQPQSAFIELLWNHGDRGQAKEEFENLVSISSSIDMNSPLFSRIDNIAKNLGYTDDWRQPIKLASDLGLRPDLDQLGPFRWTPSEAPQWELPNANDQMVSLNDYQGKPVIVVFYLGFGCLHCVEQLQVLGPAAKEFSEAGIEIVGIGSDNLEGLKNSIHDYNETVPFPLLSDDSLSVFRKYRTFDDFENQPLHGTFLIDATGRIRWQDISYEPFMDTGFLLNESKRLLSITAGTD